MNLQIFFQKLLSLLSSQIFLMREMAQLLGKLNIFNFSDQALNLPWKKKN